MLISASRRTDIPAFYSEWFFRRLQAGFVLVRNPVDSRTVYRVELTPDVVDGIVFWSKNPAPMFSAYASELRQLRERIPFYFQFTVNGYGPELEPEVPAREQLCATFAALAEEFGRDAVVWRYDPIILTERSSFSEQIRNFTFLVEKLAPCTTECIISFLDLYRKTARNMRHIPFTLPTAAQQLQLAAELAAVAAGYGITLNACCETPELAHAGVGQARCIDPERISRLRGGERLTVRKDRNQRPDCGCAAAIDIGAYNTCRHGCLYCYANASPVSAMRQSSQCDPASPLLCGSLSPDDRLVEQRMSSLIDRQLPLL